MAIVNFEENSPVTSKDFVMNEKEAQSMSEFIFERVITESVDTINPVHTGIKMKTQIPVSSKLGAAGVKAATNSCTRQSSGAGLTFSEKQWEPVGIEDVFEFCVKDNSSAMSMFKPYMDKVKSYKDQFEGYNGSDLGLFVAARIEESLNQAIFRAIWMGDVNIAQYGGSPAVPGLATSADAKFFNYFDGILTQIDKAITAGDITAQSLTFASTSTTTPTEAYNAISKVWQSASPIVRADRDASFYVSGEIFAALQLYYASTQTSFSMNYLENGVPYINFLGHKVIDMSFVWDYNYINFFKSATGGAYNPRMILFTIPSNIPCGTTAIGDLTELESWYNQDSRVSKVAFGLNLDAKVLDESLIAFGVES